MRTQGLEQSFLLLERSERTDVGNVKGYPKLVLVSRAEVEAAVLDAEAATVGVVCDLRGGKLHDIGPEIVHCAERRIPAAAIIVSNRKQAA